MLRLVRLALFVAAAGAFVMAVLPHPPPLPGQPSDKLMHIVAFTVLGALGALAFPERARLQIVLGLVAFGGLIELVQAIPALHRDSEFADMVADSIAALVAVSAVRMTNLRIPK